jgi:hypothetical protein
MGELSDAQSVALTNIGTGIEFATWTSTNTRYFLCDLSGGGNDANVGYVDAAAGSTIDPTSKAKATIAGVLAIIPPADNGRSMVLMIKTGTSATALDFGGHSGYKSFFVRGSTDLTNSATDRVLVGAIIGSNGPNGDLSWTVSTATTSGLVISAGTLPAEPTVRGGTQTYVLGMRIRFDAATTTVALRNVCTAVFKITGTDTIAFGQNLAATPVAGDTFFIERPGAKVSTYTHPIFVSGASPNNVSLGAVVGIACTSSSAGFGWNSIGSGVSTPITYSFCEHTSDTQSAPMYARAGASLVFSPSWTDEAGTARGVGVGLHINRCVLTNIANITIAPRGLFVTGTQSSVATFNTNISASGNIAESGGCYYGGGVQLTSTAGIITFGNVAASTIARSRIIGSSGNGTAYTTSTSLAVEALLSTVNGCTWEGTGQASMFDPGGSVVPFGLVVALNCDMSGSNTGYGLVLRGKNRIVILTTSTFLSGLTLGDILFSDGAATTALSSLVRTNVVDVNYNDVRGATILRKVDQCQLVTLTAGYASTVGDVVRNTGVANTVALAQADTAANAKVVGVMVTTTATTGSGYMATAGQPYVNVQTTHNPGDLAWLSLTTAGRCVNAEPVTSGVQQKVFIGRFNSAASTTGYVQWEPDLIARNATDIVEVAASAGAQTFSATQRTIVVTGTIAANTTYTLPALSAASVGDSFTLKDATTSGTFNLVLARAGSDNIEGVNQASLSIATGLGSGVVKASLTVRKSGTTGGWVVV